MSDDPLSSDWRITGNEQAADAESRITGIDERLAALDAA
jgi:hypothetical protein